MEKNLVSTRTSRASKLKTKRSSFRRILMEGLERRELMAIDAAAPVFAPGTPDDYVRTWIDKLARGSLPNQGGFTGTSLAPINLSGTRWTQPTGGASPNEGDTATITWGIVADGTVFDNAVPIQTVGSASNLVAFMDGIYGTAAGPISSRPWFPLFVEAYDRWSRISGINFVYESNDDGLPVGGTNNGVVGVRPDVRIGGQTIDGNFNVLAFNYFPNNGGLDGLDGDMVIDTGDIYYAINAGGENRALLNILSHEAGHGIGLGHVIPSNGTKLMEPFISLAYSGPQHDDILAAQTLYGDNNEDLADSPINLGVIANGRMTTSGVSLDRNADTDVYLFSTLSDGRLTIQLTPVGEQYLVGPQGGTAVPVDTVQNKDLSFELLDSNGTIIARGNTTGLGQVEQVRRIAIPGSGNYRLRILGGTGETQLYKLDLVASGLVNTGIGVLAPRLLSVSPNSGEIFNPNAGNAATSNVLNESPRELIFRFSGSQQLDPATLAGIRLIRSGGDNGFGDGNEVVITPSFVGFGENDRTVVMRFGEALPDDRYRIEVLAVNDYGLPAIQSLDEQLLIPRIEGTDRDTYFFNLELGAKILAIVPQPVTRLANGSLQQERDKIEVYFNDDDLSKSVAETNSFYKLILTKDSVNGTDDAVFEPTSVVYDAALDKATLTFASAIDLLPGVNGSGTFRLRIGSNRPLAVAPSLNNVEAVNDVGDTLAAASNTIGNLTGQASFLLSASASVTVANQLNTAIVYPGGNDEPGHRDILDENHLLTGADASTAITKITYSFSEGQSYGTGSNGQPLFTSITPDQKARVREIFEFYSAQAGVDFAEVADASQATFRIVVGDLFPLNNPPQPFVPAGIAGGGLAIMNGALNWNNGLGESFFDVSLHEIGHLLGIGHSYELPSGTVMGSTGQLDSGNPIEFFFPGNHDIAHLQHIYRPDNRDVDIFRFNVPVGQKGSVVVETVAERLSNSSDLDTYLTLFKRDASGLHILAINDNYFSSDSLIRADIVGEAGAEYFVAVTSRGNENFDPKVNGTGSGGVSQGNYQLRFDYRPSDTTQIVDTSGTAVDGDSDGLPGGEFNFWFRAASPVGVAASGAPKTVFVDKDNTQASPNGSLANPYRSVQAALSAANTSGDVVRFIGSSGLDRNLATVSDNVPYEFGDGGPGKGALPDGANLTAPKGVTLMIDAGAILKFGASQVLAGSFDASQDLSGGTVQVLGVPGRQVFFTSHFDQSLGIDTNLLNTTPRKGDWGGIELRNDVDRSQGRREPERDGVFLNYIANASIQYGGGSIANGTQTRVVNPIHLSSARPTLLNNSILRSADAGISADPNSFEETLFSEPRYQFTGLFVPDYKRVGPEILGQQITDSSINGLFIRIDTLAGQASQTLDVAARLDDNGIVYVLGENLTINGTPGGAIVETTRPNLSLVTLTGVSGGALAVGNGYSYRVAFVDRNGNEGLPSTPTFAQSTTATNRSIRLTGLPAATDDFVGRRLYRSRVSGNNWDLVAELDKTSSTFLDVGSDVGTNITLTNATSIQRARTDASLVVDPGVVVKSLGARIEIGIGASMIAEGTKSKPVVFTSRNDDRYGAGATFDSNNDAAASVGRAGDWSGIVARHFSSLSIDSALITFAGGSSSIPGGFSTFNAIEVHQSEARIANSTLENNDQGNSNPGRSNRDYRGRNDASVIYAVASQPIIVNNIIRNNAASAAISIDADSMKSIPVRDYGRSTGANNRFRLASNNQGPLVVGNRLGGNETNGMRIRGATLTTESTWDDTDIVHVLETQIVIPDFHTYGGLRLQSRGDESLVVKLSGTNAGFTASGRPLDIVDRIGGSLQILGAPGFPVVLTSLSDDTVGAGFAWTGEAMVDTNNDGSSLGVVGDWRSIRLNPYSNDRNLDTTFELESDTVADSSRNDLPSSSQSIGGLANNLNGGDENVRLGFTVHGTIAAQSDLDVYQFRAVAGTSVWIDLDRTSSALDSVVELIDPQGNILVQSNNSLTEAFANSVFAAANVRAFPMSQSSYRVATQDFQSVNPLDAGFRVFLPGTVGTENTYYVRVRSSNLAPGSNAANLQNPALVANGLTSGSYRLQVRLQQQDEVAGSTIRYADIRYAQTGVEVLGLPGHSPLLSEYAETPTNPNETNAQNLGNIANSDRNAISVAGTISNLNDADWYRFRIYRDSIQTPGNLPISTIFDIDYADGLGRPDTTLWVYQLDANGANPRLILVGSDSNVADDRSAPSSTNSNSDLERGSTGPRDPFIGAQSLVDGEYLVAVTHASRVEQQMRQYYQANPLNPLFRLEPINGIDRISEDTFDNTKDFPLISSGTTSLAKQVSFAGNSNAVPFTLADVTLFTASNQAGSTSRLTYANGMTGAIEAELPDTRDFNGVNDIAVSPAGLVVGAEFIRPNVATANDASLGFLNAILHDGSAAPVARANAGIQTFEGSLNGNNPQVAQANNGTNATGVGTEFTALSFTYDPTSPVATNSLALFGVAQRGDRQPFDTYNLGANGALPAAGTPPIPGNVISTAYRNILYRIDPNTLQAVSPATAPDRTGNYRARGTGTDTREFGIFAEVGTYAWDRNNTGTGDNIVVTRQANGDIIGLAQVDSTLFGITDQGELWSMQMGSFTAGFQRGATLVSSSLPTGLTGLTAGPRNVENGAYANTLFATMSDGTLHAFDLTGAPVFIFPGARSSIVAPAGSGLGTIAGIDFGALDVNLWHVTGRRSNDPGHGRPVTPDDLRPTAQNGGNSLYFGFEPTGNNAIPGSWDRSYRFAAGVGTYNLAGGAEGAVESNYLDLRSFSVEDKPMLYFNYYLDTQGSNGPNDDDNPMLDSFRVYAIGEDGVSRLLATNNNADDQNYLNFINEVDPALTTNFDVYGNSHKPQVLFDTVETNGTNWRQARIPLASVAGENNVRLRFEFSTGGSFDSADSLRGGEELRVVAGARIDDGDFVTIRGPGPTGALITRNFEFDHGLVLNLPSGGSIAPGSTITVEGRVFTFVTGAPANARQIRYTVNDAPATIAAGLRTALIADGFNVFTNATRPNTLNVQSGSRTVTAGGLHLVSGLDGAIIQDFPGVRTGNIRVPVNQAMDAAAVRDALIVVLAATFNTTGQQANLAPWKFHNDTLRLYNYSVLADGPFQLTARRIGDTFGAKDPVAGGSSKLVQASLRSSNNAREGLYIDDIIIAAAERGEIAINSTADAPTFQTNSLLSDGGYPDPFTKLPTSTSIPAGTYQLEIRSGATYSFVVEPDTFLGRNFDTNARLNEQVNLVVGASAMFADGATFTLSDGLSTVTFEFDVTTSVADSAVGTAQGRVPLTIRADMTGEEIATVIRNAINGPLVQSVLRIKAAALGEMSDGTGTSIYPDRATVIQLHGSIAANTSGSLATGLAGISLVQEGIDSAFGEDLGDSNRKRDQGQIVIASNTIRNSQTVGVLVDAAARGQANLAQFVGDRPYPGSVRNLITNNTANLATGVVVANNIVAANGDGGIRISGDDTNGDALAASQIARVFNNTVYGNQNGDIGIQVNETAAATILNNIVANSTVGINRAGSNANTIVGANLFQANATNIVGGGASTFSINLLPTDPLFVDPTNFRFYLSSGSQAIDSSLSSLAEIGLLTQVKNAIGLPLSPLVAPPRDVVGVARVDDLTVNTPAGQGQNVNIDRGAVERADTARLKAVLSNPLDNDVGGIDKDSNSTYVQILSGALDHFSILLTDGFGTGPDERTVLDSSVIVSENGRTLVSGVDYSFGYDASSKTIRLTPLAGLWRSDSVYEVSIVNATTFRIDTVTGASLNDTDSIVATLSDGSSRTLEFDSGFIIDIPSTLTGATANGQTFTYSRASGGTRTFEFNVVGDTVVGNNTTIIDLLATDDYLVIAAKIKSNLETYVTGGAFPVADLGKGRVHVGGSLGDSLTLSGNTFTVRGTPGVTGALRIAVPTTGGLGVTDGQTFSIINNGTTVTFEFDSNNVSLTGNRAITFFASDSPTALAGRIVASIAGAGLGLSPASLAAGEFILNESRNTIVNLLGSPLTSTGVAGGAIRVPFVPSGNFSAQELASRLLTTINGIGTNVNAYLTGTTSILVQNVTNLTGVLTSKPSTISDIAGNSVEPNRSNGLTQFTIVMPDVKMDFGDAPYQTLLVNNGARHAQLPPDAVAVFLGASVDTETNGQPSVSANGDNVIGADEDGVTLLTPFNNRMPDASFSVTTTGVGFVDAWIDWNRDGDFADVGEQVLSNRQVADGSETFTVAMSPSAIIGTSYLRVRVSAFGNLLATGVAVGGEVEDYAIELISNFAPVAVADSYTTSEDTALTVNAAAGLVSNDTDADAGSTLSVVDSDTATAGIQPSVLPQSGTVVLNADGSFTYTPNADFAGVDTFAYFVTDGILPSTTAATVTITVNSVNDAPVFVIPTSVDVNEDEASVADTSGNQTQNPVTIAGVATNVAAGPTGASDESSQTLSFNVVATQPSFFEVAPTLVQNSTDPTKWDLVFTLAKNVNRDFANGLNNRIEITLVDNGSNTSPNVNTSATQTLSLNIIPVNDPPISDSTTIDAVEDTAVDIQAASILAGDMPAPTTAIDENGQTVAITSFAATSTNGGTVQTFVTGSTISSIRYTPPANFSGQDTITYSIVDDGSPSAIGTGTLTINVAAVNDPPSFVLPPVVTVQEDQGSFVDGTGNQVQVPIGIAGFLTSINPGPAGSSDELSQAVAIEVVALEPSFFEVQPTIVRDLNDPTQATLTFTLAKHRNNAWTNGLQNFVRVTLRDDGSNVSPNSNQSVASTFSIDITPVNDPPLTGSFTPSVLEDSTTTFTASQLLSTAVPATNDAVDEATQVLRISQMDQQTAQNGVVSLIFTGNAVTSFRYIPPPNFIGTDTFAYQIADSGNPSQSAIGTVTVTVNAVNDAPTFAAGPAVTVDEDSGAYSATWASNILAGPSGSDETTGALAQTVSFEVIATNSSLFAVAPTIAPNGTLSFTPAVDANGTSVLSVTAIDSGLSNSPNVNRSTTVLLTITVAAVNDAPTFTPGGNIVVDEDAGSVQLNWATNVRAAAGLASSPSTASDEQTQVVSFSLVSNSNSGLFATAPSIDSAGVLSFTPALNANGSAIVSFVARDDGSSTSPNVNQSTAVTFTISVNAINDAPIGTPETFATNENTSLSITSTAGLLLNDIDPDSGDVFSVVAGQVTSQRGAAVTLNADGSFTYDPTTSTALNALKNGESQQDTFLYLLTDTLGAVSNPVTVTVNVAGVNDAPNAVNDNFSVIPNTATNLNVLANDVDPDSTIDVATVEIGLTPTAGTVSVLANGQISYRPNSSFQGQDSFSYRVKDSTGLLSNEATVTVRINTPPVAFADSASVLAGSSVVINVLTNDVDADGNSTINTGSVTIVATPAVGTAVVQSNGTVLYTAPAGATVTTSFSYTIADTVGAVSAPASVNVNVVSSLYQNPSNRFDVNADGFVSPVDALIIINDINRRGTRPLSPTEFTPPPFIDVNGNGSVEPLDILQIINFLNRRAAAEGEAAPSASQATPPVSAATWSAVYEPIVVGPVTPEQMIATVGEEVVKSVRRSLVESAFESDYWEEDDTEADELSTVLSESPTASSNVDALFSDLDSDF